MGFFGKGGDLARWSQAHMGAIPSPVNVSTGALADALGGTADLVNQYVANPVLALQGALSGSKPYQFPTGAVQAAVPQPKGMMGRVGRAALAMAIPVPGGKAEQGLQLADEMAQTMRNLKWGETAQDRLIRAQRVLSQHGGDHPEALGVAHAAADELGLPRIDASKTLPQAPPVHANLYADPPAARPAPAPQIIAYHGSPSAPFDAFSNEAIGSGEGAASYGHGHYFAENPDTARSYRDALTPDANMQVGGVPLRRFADSLEARADAAPMSQAQQLYDQLGVVHNLWNVGDVKGVRDIADQHGPEAMSWFEQHVAPNFTRDGNLYQVGINANPDHFLDWDAGLHQQSPHVQEALRQFGINADPAAMRAHDDWLRSALTSDDASPAPPWPWDPSGGAIYESSKIVPGGYRDPAAASQALANAGIPGIKYFDQGSRPDGSGTRNFVVFDPSHVDILKRYAAPGMIGAGGAAFGASQIPSPQPDPNAGS